MWGNIEPEREHICSNFMDRIEVKKIPQIHTTLKMTSTKLLNHIYIAI